MKQETKNKKLIDILRVSKDTNVEADLIARTEQANINTQQEVLNLKGQIQRQELAITQALQANPFSASVLYATRKEKQLMELKLASIKEILTELF